MINIGIIGTGVGLRTHYPAFKTLKNVKNISLVGSSPERTAYFAKKNGIVQTHTSYQDLCDDPNIDLICVTSPNTIHHKQMMYALKAKKNIICEKPLAMSLDEINEIQRASDRYNKLLIINHQLRFNPYVKKIQELLSTNHLGRVYSIRIHQQGTGFSDRSLKWMWSFDSKLGGGVRLAMGSHLIDLIRFFFPKKEFSHIRCTLDRVVDERLDDNDNTHEVTGSAYFAMKGRLNSMIDVDLSATAAAFGNSRFDISIYGTDGEIQFNLDEKLSFSNMGSIGNPKKLKPTGVFQDEIDNKVSIFSGSFRYFAPKIVDALIDNENHIQGACSLEDSLWQQAILDTCLDSWHRGKEVVRNNEIKPQQNIVS